MMSNKSFGEVLSLILATIFLIFAIIYVICFVVGLSTHQPNGTTALSGVCALFCMKSGEFLIDDR